MVDHNPKPAASRRLSTGTIALGAAGLLAATAVGIALFRSNDEIGATPAKTEAAAPAAEGKAPSVDAAIASLTERLRQDPDNHEGWFLLGMATRESGQFAESEQAFRRAMELSPRNADYLAYLGEALLLKGGATPPPEAETLLRRAIEIEPKNPQARYYLATMRDIQGDHKGAVDDLVTLLKEAPADAPWESQVRSAVESIAAKNNINLAGRLPAARTPSPSIATAGIPGPTREQLDAARTIPPSEQDAMVKGMVDRLAARLQANPQDAEGWIRLMRSRMVLNQRNEAKSALTAALAAFQNDAATQQRLRTAAGELGVPAA